MTDSMSSPMPSDGTFNSAPPAVSAPLAWIEIFLGTLLSPRQTFRAIDSTEHAQSNFAGAFVAVALVCFMEGLRHASARHPERAIFAVVVALVLGVITWLALSGAIGLAGQAFGQPRSKFGALVATMGWSLIPWIFMGPIACLHNVLGHATALLVLLPALWVFALQLTAITETYNLKLWQTLCLTIVIPALVWTAQITQLVKTLGAVLSVA